MRFAMIALGWFIPASSGWAGTILLSQQPQPECQVVSFATKEVVSDDCYNVPGIDYGPSGIMEMRATWGDTLALQLVSHHAVGYYNNTTDLEVVGFYDTAIVYEQDFVLTGGSGLVDVSVIGDYLLESGRPRCSLSIDTGSEVLFPTRSSGPDMFTIGFGVPFGIYMSAGVSGPISAPPLSGFGGGFMQGGSCQDLATLSFAPRPEAVITGQVLVEPFDAPPPGVEDVPEPGTFLMLAAGLIGLIARKRSA